MPDAAALHHVSPVNPIDVVVFDIGNVLIRWDPRLLYRPLFDENEALMEDFLSSVCTHDWNQEMDRGMSFAEGVARLTAERPDCAELIRIYDECWQQMVPGAIDGTVELLERLKARGVPLYALTNFSAEKFAETLERFDFLKLFDGIVVSAHERLIKPDPRFYRVLFERHRIAPERAVFIDDLPANIEVARSLGMTGWVFDGPEPLERRLVEAGLLEG